VGGGVEGFRVHRRQQNKTTDKILNIERNQKTVFYVLESELISDTLRAETLAFDRFWKKICGKCFRDF